MAEGNTCFEEKIKAYNEDLIDRTNCDCKNDCEMVHTFSTLQVDNTYQVYIYLRDAKTRFKYTPYQVK